MVLELARPSEARCFPPGRWFFRSCFTAAAAGNRSCRKMLFFSDFRRHVREFFGVVLELARPSEARCFPPGRWFFRSCFTAAAAGNRSCRNKSCRRQKKRDIFLGIQKGREAVFVGKFEHGFGTQLGAVLRWRGVPSASLMLAVWSYQTTAAGDKKRNFFLGIQKGR